MATVSESRGSALSIEIRFIIPGTGWTQPCENEGWLTEKRVSKYNRNFFLSFSFFFAGVGWISFIHVEDFSRDPCHLWPKSRPVPCTSEKPWSWWWCLSQPVATSSSGLENRGRPRWCCPSTTKIQTKENPWYSTSSQCCTIPRWYLLQIFWWRSTKMLVWKHKQECGKKKGKGQNVCMEGNYIRRTTKVPGLVTLHGSLQFSKNGRHLEE